MRNLGIGNIDGIDFFESIKELIGCFGKCKEMF